ncbi:MAG: hypothetical protein BWY19_00308 [bacterium ADurb.Bin212]|nr:MAG: hypothetical protein BWY19_00308 [bacterium ADurb.Bin212]
MKLNNQIDGESNVDVVPVEKKETVSLSAEQRGRNFLDHFNAAFLRSLCISEKQRSDQERTEAEVNNMTIWRKMGNFALNLIGAGDGIRQMDRDKNENSNFFSGTLSFLKGITKGIIRSSNAYGIFKAMVGDGHIRGYSLDNNARVNNNR